MVGSNVPPEMLNFSRKKWTFFESAVTFLILDKKSSIFFSYQGLVEISSKMKSFVDILILGHPHTLYEDGYLKNVLGGGVMKIIVHNFLLRTSLELKIVNQAGLTTTLIIFLDRSDLTSSSWRMLWRKSKSAAFSRSPMEILL